MGRSATLRGAFEPYQKSGDRSIYSRTQRGGYELAIAFAALHLGFRPGLMALHQDFMKFRERDFFELPLALAQRCRRTSL